MTTSDQPTPKSNPAALIVRIVLFLILGVLLCGLAYEYLVPRSQAADAIGRLEQLDQENADRGHPTTDKDVQKLFGFKPQREQPDDATLIEHYVWASVVPFRKHDLWVVYQRNLKGEWTHLAHGLNKPPEYDASGPPEPEDNPDSDLGPEPDENREADDDSSPGTG